MNDDPYVRTFSARPVLRGERARASTVETVELTATVLGSTHIPNRGMLSRRSAEVAGTLGTTYKTLVTSDVTRVGKGLNVL